MAVGVGAPAVLFLVSKLDPGRIHLLPDRSHDELVAGRIAQFSRGRDMPFSRQMQFLGKGILQDLGQANVMSLGFFRKP